MGQVVVIAIVLIALAAAVMLGSAIRRRDTTAAIGSLSGETAARDRKARKAAAGAPTVPAGRLVEETERIERVGASIVPSKSSGEAEVWTPPDPEQIGVSRRKFLNRSAATLMGVGALNFGAAAMIAFLWPTKTGGFGSKINAGKIADLKAAIVKGNGFLYKPEARAWITEYPDTALTKAKAAYSADELAGMEAGLVALYQKCPHLGCRVPSCATSQWFECPCHGSQYNQVGEKKAGPAPRGMDRFGMEIAGDSFVINTGMIIQGPPIGVNTTGQEAEGPHCLGGGTHH